MSWIGLDLVRQGEAQAGNKFGMFEDVHGMGGVVWKKKISTKKYRILKIFCRRQFPRKIGPCSLGEMFVQIARFGDSEIRRFIRVTRSELLQQQTSTVCAFRVRAHSVPGVRASQCGSCCTKTSPLTSLQEIRMVRAANCFVTS